jgi:hypothetical protein
MFARKVRNSCLRGSGYVRDEMGAVEGKRGVWQLVQTCVMRRFVDVVFGPVQQLFWARSAVVLCPFKSYIWTRSRVTFGPVQELFRAHSRVVLGPFNSW